MVGPTPRRPQLIYKLPYLTHKPIVGGFFLMHPTNTNIVRRTWGLLQSRARTQEGKNLAYGEAFDYDEFMQLPNYIAGAGISLLIFFFALFTATLPPVRIRVIRIICQPIEIHLRLSLVPVVHEQLCSAESWRRS